MNSLTDPHEEETRNASPDREITLGTTLLLGIFFALAALCAVFFGFGYSLGARHASAVNASAEAQPGSGLNASKPSAGSAAPVARPTSPDTSAAVPSRPANSPPPAPETVSVDPAQTNARPSRTHSTAEAAPPPAAAPPGATQFLVQIAAVTHQEDADLIASTLTRRGYAVNIRPESQDKLLHVQVGPFASKKDAEAMRQRLMADGFNAFIK